MNSPVKNFPRVKAVVTVIARGKANDKASSPESAHFYQLRAAHRVNVFEPFTLDQKLLNGLLSELHAGKDSCEKAWELYTNKTAA